MDKSFNIFDDSTSEHIEALVDIIWNSIMFVHLFVLSIQPFVNARILILRRLQFGFALQKRILT